MRRGWFKDSWRHSLASRGIKTNKYYARPRPPGSRAKRGRGGAAQPIPKVKQIPAAEEALTTFFIRDLPPEKRKRARELPSEIEELKDKKTKIQDKLFDVRGEVPETAEELRQLRSRKRTLNQRLNALQDGQGTAAEVSAVLQEVEDVEDKLEALASTGKVDETKEAKEQVKAVQEELTAVNKTLSEKQDELDLLTGRGGRKAKTVGEQAATIPREKIVVDKREKFLPDVENLQEKQERAREGQFRQGQKQIKEFKDSIREKKDSGEISAAEFRKLSRRADDLADTMGTATVFTDPKETSIERIAGRPKRITKQTREVVSLPKKVDIKERADAERTSRLKSARAQKEALKELAKLQKEGAISEDK